MIKTIFLRTIMFFGLSTFSIPSFGADVGFPLNLALSVNQQETTEQNLSLFFVKPHPSFPTIGIYGSQKYYEKTQILNRGFGLEFRDVNIKDDKSGLLYYSDLKLGFASYKNPAGIDRRFTTADFSFMVGARVFNFITIALGAVHHTNFLSFEKRNEDGLGMKDNYVGPAIELWTLL